MEILVSLVLVSILGMVVWSGLINAQGLIRRTLQSAAETVRTLQLDEALRAAAARVRVPYWQLDTGVTTDSGSLRVPWVDGRKEVILTVETDERGVTIRIDGVSPPYVVGPFRVPVTSMSQITATEHAGLSIDVETRPGGGLLTLSAGFGARPWPGEAPR